MPTLYNNNAFSTLAAAITSSGQTSVTVQTGHGDRFPIIVSPDVAFITLENTAGTREVIKITARAATSDVLTVTRGEEGTSATTWAIGDLIEQRITAGELTDFRTRPGFTTTATSAGTLTLTKGSTEIQTLTGSTTHTVVLPVVSTLYTGKSFTINNNSTGIVTVNSSGSNAVVAIQPGNSADIICVLITGTTAASWTVMTAFGASDGALPGTLSVGGTATMAAINASGTVAMAGAATVGTTLAVTGTSTMAAINASGLVAMAGSATVGTTLAVTGTSTMAAINASGTVAMAGAATVGTTLAVTGTSTMAAGSAAAPSIISTTGTADTGMYFPGTDIWSIATAGVQRFQITAAGFIKASPDPAILLNATSSYHEMATNSETQDLLRMRANHASYTGTGIFLYIDRAANSAFKLIDLQANAVSKFTVDGAGAVTIPGTLSVGSGYTGSVASFTSSTGSSKTAFVFIDATYIGFTTGANLNGSGLSATTSAVTLQVAGNGIVEALSTGATVTGTLDVTGDTTITGDVKAGSGAQSVLALFGANISDRGGGNGIIVMSNATSPGTSYAGGGQLYVQSGALRFRGSSGTITVIAPA